ncbi:hypothetical protein H5410_045320 [Solanum commersonii]|uniref:Uncharacterized protein n=1 Tax=Solanum commersonii TaxID=4109 RepID=A0A9J5XCB8_SOLCO|nr:hypothetical protein H5410_045320 [Solanum commersonii]
MHTLPASTIDSVRKLSNVLYVPNLKANLIAVESENWMTMAKGHRVGRMFLLESVHRHLHRCFLSVSAADVSRLNKLLTL